MSITTTYWLALILVNPIEALSRPGNQYESQCTNSGAHSWDKWDAVISAPFEKSVNIESTETEKSFHLGYLFKQVVSCPRRWAHWLFVSLVVGTEIHTITQHGDTEIEDRATDGKQRTSSRWRAGKWQLIRLQTYTRNTLRNISYNTTFQTIRWTSRTSQFPTFFIHSQAAFQPKNRWPF